MQNKTIIISTSVVLLASLLIYNSLEDTNENTDMPTSKEPKKLIKEKNNTQTINIQKETDKTLEKKVQEEQLTSKYNIATLPENIAPKEKKQRFKELLLPVINNVYAQLDAQYNDTKQMIENNTNKVAIKKLILKYNAKNEADLLVRLKPHPKSIAMSQAAIQSGWATSRFTLIANNVFGIWSFDENESRVQANETRDGEAIYVRSYKSIHESVEDYYKLLATSPLFEEFRKQKMTTDDPSILIQSLDKYYKDGDDYTKGLNELMRYNEFNQYDEK